MTKKVKKARKTVHKPQKVLWAIFQKSDGYNYTFSTRRSAEEFMKESTDVSGDRDLIGPLKYNLGES